MKSIFLIFPPRPKSPLFAHSVLPLPPSSFTPFIPLRLSTAFSLTEVVIAMGVAAIAFTSIIALFPLGLNMSKESYEETQAALLAQTIFSDFKDNLTGTNTFSSGFLLQIAGLNSPVKFSTNYVNVSNGPSTHYVAYKLTNEADTPNNETMLRPFAHSTSPNGFYNNGTNNALAIAKIDLSYCFPLNNMTTGPNRVDITIETPGNLPTEKRKQLIFTGGFQ
jgi:type II secretory pathway pseudopilin PulG